MHYALLNLVKLVKGNFSCFVAIFFVEIALDRLEAQAVHHIHFLILIFLYDISLKLVS